MLWIHGDGERLAISYSCGRDVVYDRNAIGQKGYSRSWFLVEDHDQGSIRILWVIPLLFGCGILPSALELSSLVRGADGALGCNAHFGQYISPLHDKKKDLVPRDQCIYYTV